MQANKTGTVIAIGRTVDPHNTLTVFVETGKNRTNIGLIGILQLGLYY